MIVSNTPTPAPPGLTPFGFFPIYRLFSPCSRRCSRAYIISPHENMLAAPVMRSEGLTHGALSWLDGVFLLGVAYAEP